MAATRIHLPETRPSLTSKIQACGFKMYVTVGFDESTQDEKGNPIVRPMEVFVKIAKHGTEISGLMDSLATIISIALQSEVPWARIESKLRHHKFGESDQKYTSIVDAIAVAVGEIVAQRCGVVMDDAK